jgi:predicted DNA-binding transcriptional regulator AlpA
MSGRAGFRGDYDNPFMDQTQAQIIGLLREIHLLALKEIERLNFRIAELENENHPPPAERMTRAQRNTGPINPTPPAKWPEMMNERQLSEYLNIAVRSLQKWRLFRKGPKFVKVGGAVRYRRREVDAWLDSCAGSN